LYFSVSLAAQAPLPLVAAVTNLELSSHNKLYLIVL
jgi:hypothetical protein